MDHKFQPSFTDVKKCNRCTFAPELHGDNAVCEACSNVGNLNPCNNMALCRDCIAKEVENTLPSVPTNELVTAEPLSNLTLQMSKQIDSSITVSSDLFNAATVPIMEIKAAIDADTTIANDKKHYRLAEVLLERFNTHKAAIFAMQQKIVAEHSNQRAIQQYLNNLAHKLQGEEREKLKISDINYKPEVVKEIKPKVKAAKAVKFTDKEIKSICAQMNVAEFMVRMTIMAKQCSLLEAVAMVVQANKVASEVGKLNTPTPTMPIAPNESDNTQSK